MQKTDTYSSLDKNLKTQLSKTTDHGTPNMDDSNSLKAGKAGPILHEDFIFGEKLRHFDRERIPERVVHARGFGVHGHFQVYSSMKDYTTAHFLQDPNEKTPVFVRFSTVAGSRGSADTVRDVRGFATKFYTKEGNYDLVGNNIPVFFIQDGIQFPDLIHALKPHPNNEIPQATTAHDSFWDFISLTPEASHMVMWILSDRALPRSFSMMQGFGVHTFRMINERGEGTFVKFHWKPKRGVHSFLFEEAITIAGQDPDFLRRDLYENIELGNFPEFELGIQFIKPDQVEALGIDIFDSTKLIPEELIPVTPVGRMVLDKNPANFFAETEQVAFSPANIVPGIDFTPDPLLQGRLFSYEDTHVHRLGSTNFKELPINRPVAPVYNNHQDGFMQMEIPQETVNYWPNSSGASLRGGSGCPMFNGTGFMSFPDRLSGFKDRKKDENLLRDHFSQATLFWNSMSDIEKDHIVDAAQFELGKVTKKEVRLRMLRIFEHVDHELASRVAEKLGLHLLSEVKETNHGRSSPALSMMNTNKESVKGRKVAVLVGDGVDNFYINKIKTQMEKAGARTETIAKFGTVKAKNGQEIEVDRIFANVSSTMYDAVIVAGGKECVEKLKGQGPAIKFVMESFKHLKPIAAVAEGGELLKMSGLTLSDCGIFLSKNEDFSTIESDFIDAIKGHRFWERAKEESYASLPF